MTIYTTIGTAPIGIASSSIVSVSGVVIATGAALIEISSSGTAYLSFTTTGLSAIDAGSSGTIPPYLYNWTDGVLGGDFAYPIGMTVDIEEIPPNVGATGSLRWPPDLLDNAVVSVSLHVVMATVGTISFWVKVDAEQSCDILYYTFDDEDWGYGDSQDPPAWEQVIWTDIQPGEHTIRWTYAKDGSNTVAPDTAWLALLRIDGGITSPFWVDVEPYTGEGHDIIAPILLTGMMEPHLPEPIPPVDFDGIPDPTVAPICVSSDTASGHLSSGTYRYAYAAWIGDIGQATAPSPWSDEVVLTTEDTVTLTYPIIPGADGYIVYRMLIST